MIQEGLRVTIPLKDKTLCVVAVEVQLVLQSPGVFSAHQFRAFRGEMLKLVKLAIMDCGIFICRSRRLAASLLGLGGAWPL